MKLKMQRRLAWWRMNMKKEAICPNCGQRGAHFAPPSMGEEGFFICTPPKTLTELCDTDSAALERHLKEHPAS